MPTIKNYNMEAILDILRTFTYTTEVEGETVTVNVELFTHAQTPMATRLFLQAQGDRLADDILIAYGKEEVSAADIADIIKVVCVQRWKHFLEMWKANYNPIWNVDGTEKRTIVTQYGKVTTMVKNTKLTDEQKTVAETTTQYGQKLTDEQKTVAESTTQYGQKLTDEQKSNASDTTTFGKVVTHTNPTETGKVAAFDSADFVDATQRSATNNSDTDSGTETVTSSIGKVEHAQSGSDSTTSSIGKVEHAQSGSDSTTSSIGKVEHAHSGSDTDTDSGSDTVTDTFIRGGNIGVTMTQQLLTAEETFWSKYTFFEHWFNDIAEQISLPIWG